MANDPIATDLTKLHTSIRDGISKKFPAFKTVEFYLDDESDDLSTPACLLELDEFEHSDDEDIGTEEIVIALRFSARLIFSREYGADAPIRLRRAAAALCAFINKNRFCGHVSPARILSAGPDFFRPDLSGKFAIWRIEWVHYGAVFGESVWDDESPPVRVIFSNEDNLGDPHNAHQLFTHFRES